MFFLFLRCQINDTQDTLKVNGNPQDSIYNRLILNYIFILDLDHTIISLSLKTAYYLHDLTARSRSDLLTVS